MSARPHDLEHEHWRLRQSLAVWQFRLARSATETSQAAVERYLVSAVAGLPGFAEVESVEWVTYSAGDDAAVVRPEGSVDVTQLREPFRILDDVIEVSALLTPVCVSTDGVEFVVPQGADLMIEIDTPGDPREDVDAPILLRLQLHTDLYSPRTWGKERENAALASINGPRLTAFLRYVREGMGGVLDEIDAQGYEGWVTEEGFSMASVTR